MLRSENRFLVAIHGIRRNAIGQIDLQKFIRECAPYAYIYQTYNIIYTLFPQQIFPLAEEQLFKYSNIISKVFFISTQKCLVLFIRNGNNRRCLRTNWELFPEFIVNKDL